MSKEEQAIAEFEQMLAEYTLVNSCLCNIIHIKPTGEQCCLTDGYSDAQWFTMTGYNTVTHERINLGRHDNLDTSDVRIRTIRVVRNGETFIRVDGFVQVWAQTQSAILQPYREQNYQKPLE